MALAARERALAAAESELSLVIAECVKLADAWKVRDQEEGQRHETLLRKLDALDHRLAAAQQAQAAAAEPPLGFVPDPAIVLDFNRYLSPKPVQPDSGSTPADDFPPPNSAHPRPRPAAVPAELRNWLLDRCRDLPRLAARLDRLLDELEGSAAVPLPRPKPPLSSDPPPAGEKPSADADSPGMAAHQNHEPEAPPARSLQAEPAPAGERSRPVGLATRFLGLLVGRAR
jgi:hypothetical protein